MKTFIKSLLIILIFLNTLSISSYSQELPDAQKNLQRFVGNWLCKDLSLTIGEKPYKGVFFFNCKSVLDGKGIYAEEGFDNAELGNMRGLNLMSYDPNLKLIHWYTIDDKGTCHDHIGYWTDRDHFYAEYQGIVEETVYVEKIYFGFITDSKIDFRLTGENNGVVTEKITGEFVKK
jgi:hypothetical protein